MSVLAERWWLDLDQGAEQDLTSTSFPRPSVFDWLLNDAEPVAVSQHFLADALGIRPLAIHTVAVDYELVSQISFGYQQGGCNRNIVGPESRLRVFNV